HARKSISRKTRLRGRKERNNNSNRARECFYEWCHSFWVAERAGRFSCSERRAVRNDDESCREAGSCVTASRADRLQAFVGKGERSAKNGTLSQILSRCLGTRSAGVCRRLSVRGHDG